MAEVIFKSNLCASCLRREFCTFADYIPDLVECSSFEVGCFDCSHRQSCRVYRSSFKSDLNLFAHIAFSSVKPLCTREFTFPPKYKKANKIDFLTGELL